MSKVLRKSNGQPLREAMRAAGLSGPKLAAATRHIDPQGKGVSAAAIGFITGCGRTARERCRPRTAQLIADALGHPVHELFAMPAPSTVTVEKAIADAEEE
ncbi:XRE family transcriptional regulator [Streptomyces triculaminicus]|uniref:XRE family transcriptional regulator n=1 Tax=Streptomyces triculaminicus TaxID=2816232 RepID=UPI0037996929